DPHRPEVEPGPHPARLRPAQAGREARHRRSRRPGRRLHARRPAQPRCGRRPGQRREPGDRRARGAREGRAWRGGRRIRLPHRRPDGSRTGGDDRHPLERTADRRVRGRGREVEQPSFRRPRVRAVTARQGGAGEAARGRVPRTEVMRRVPVAGAALVTLAFLALPIVAVFARLSFAHLSSSVVTDALVVSLKTNAVAQAFVLLLGTPTAYVLASRRFPGRSLVVTLVELPIVLPPAVAGIGLLAAFGRMGLLHTSLPFTQTAVVVAVAFVAGPLYVRQAIAAFEGVDETLVAASRTLGAGPLKTF